MSTFNKISMQNNRWYDYFLESLSEKYPKKVHLTQALMSLLDIEREAVYRRLRKDILFPFHEIVTIASAWNISLDKITGINAGLVPFQMHPINYANLSKKDIQYLQQVIQITRQMGEFPDSEAMNICNRLPCSLFVGFKHLHKFYLFKWLYQYGDVEKTVPLSQIAVPAKKLDMTAEYYQATKLVSNTIFVLDSLIFDYLVHDVRYFHSIWMITDEEKELIKKDLRNLLDYMFEIANKGCFPETQNKVALCISLLNINTNYSYIYTKETKACYIHVFDKHELQSFDANMVTNFKAWMQLKKKTSFQISEVDEVRRIEFFTKQYKLIEEL